MRISLSKANYNLLILGCLVFVLLWLLIFCLLLFTPEDHQYFSSVNADGVTSVSDFIHYYQAGAMTLSPDRHFVFDPATQLKWTNALIYPNKIDVVFYFQGMPYTFPMLAPLAMLPKSTAFIVWSLVSLITGITGLCLLSTKFLGKELGWSKIELTLFLASALVSAPSIVNYRIGQSGWLLVGLFSFYFWFLAKKQHVLSGAVLSLSTFKPQYTPLLLVPLVSGRRWLALASFLCVEVLQIILAGATIGWENVLNYPHILFTAETSKEVAGVYPEQMISLRSLLSLLGNAQLALIVNAICLLVATVACFYIWRQRWTKDDDNTFVYFFRWQAAVTLVLCLLLSPHTHIGDLSILAVSAALTLPMSGMKGNSMQADLSAKLWTITFFTFPLFSWLIYASLPMMRAQLFSAMLLLWAASGLYHLWAIARRLNSKPIL